MSTPDPTAPPPWFKHWLAKLAGATIAIVTVIGSAVPILEHWQKDRDDHIRAILAEKIDPLNEKIATLQQEVDDIRRFANDNGADLHPHLALTTKPVTMAAGSSQGGSQ